MVTFRHSSVAIMFFRRGCHPIGNWLGPQGVQLAHPRSSLGWRAVLRDFFYKNMPPTASPGWSKKTTTMRLKVISSSGCDPIVGKARLALHLEGMEWTVPFHDVAWACGVAIGDGEAALGPGSCFQECGFGSAHEIVYDCVYGRRKQPPR